MKKLTALLLSIALIIIGATPTFAATRSSKSSAVISPNYVQIAEVDNGLYPDGSVFEIYAATFGYSNATSCYVKAVLQRQSGSSWTNYHTWTATSPSSHEDYVEIDTFYSVPTGYNYRLVTTHSVTVGSNTEYESVTSGVVTST